MSHTFLQAHLKKWSEAIQSLQHAIRGYPTSADLWEVLNHHLLVYDFLISQVFVLFENVSVIVLSLTFFDVHNYADVRSCLWTNGNVYRCT